MPAFWSLHQPMSDHVAIVSSSSSVLIQVQARLRNEWCIMEQELLDGFASITLKQG